MWLEKQITDELTVPQEISCAVEGGQTVGRETRLKFLLTETGTVL